MNCKKYDLAIRNRIHSFIAYNSMCLKTKKCTQPTRSRSTECLFVVFFFNAITNQRIQKQRKEIHTRTQCTTQNHTVSKKKNRKKVMSTRLFCIKGFL